MSRTWAFTRAVMLLGLVVAAGCGDDSDKNDGGVSCGELGQACENGASCCSGACDETAKTCIPGGCGTVGVSCTSGLDCCTLHCGTDGKCSADQCKQNGSSCASGGECCSQNCAADNTCQPVVVSPECATVYQKCTKNEECCSKNCQNNVCEPSGATCQPVGDVCLKDQDCCSAKCTIPQGLQAGTCASVNASGSGTCTQDNEPCLGSCTTCCSRVCTPTLTGGHICAPPSGCRMAGDICHQDSDCCGGTNPDAMGKVTCNFIDEAKTVGTCSNPTGCDPEGDSCGLMTGLTSTCGNSRESCCGCTGAQGGPATCCKLDSAGIPRCFGSSDACPNGYTGVAPCCIAAGGACTFSSECCNGAPCLPDQSGALKCGTACSMSGGSCRANGDCCAGLSCVIPAGQLTGTCGTSTTQCSLVGQSCSTSQACCSGLTCWSQTDNAACTTGSTNCSCMVPPG